MAYKKSSPSLQDSIEVFLDQVQLIDETSKKLSEKSETITKALYDAQKINIKPDLSELDSKIQLMRKHEEGFELMMNNQKKELQEVLKKSNFNSLYSFLSIIICLLVTCLLLYFCIKISFEKKELDKNLKSSQNFNKELGSYIKNKGLEKDFYKFQESKNKEN